MKDINWQEQYPLNTFKGETKKELIEFISQTISEAVKEEREQIITTIKALKLDCYHDSHSHCMEEMCWIHEDGGFNQGIQ